MKDVFGKDVTSDVINREVFEAVMKFIEDNKLNVLGQPVPVEVKALDFSQKDFTFEYDLALAPDLNIKLDKETNLPYYEITVSDEMVKEQDQAFRKRFWRSSARRDCRARCSCKGRYHGA